jgi:hypothetical protein
MEVPLLWVPIDHHLEQRKRFKFDLSNQELRVTFTSA